MEFITTNEIICYCKLKVENIKCYIIAMIRVSERAFRVGASVLSKVASVIAGLYFKRCCKGRSLRFHWLLRWDFIDPYALVILMYLGLQRFFCYCKKFKKSLSQNILWLIDFKNAHVFFTNYFNTRLHTENLTESICMHYILIFV